MNKSFLRPVFLSFLLILLILFFARTVNATGWANPSFERCKDINISNSGSETLTNFPAYINLTHDLDMLSDFRDIRFYSNACNNGGSQLDYEIEDYTASTRAHIWVRIPSLPSSGKQISVYYKNNTAISSGENSTGVWDSNYVAVWHFGEGSGTSLNDSTSNAQSATLESNHWIAGNTGNAYDFNGSERASTDSTFAAPVTGTLEFWFRPDSTASSRPLGLHDGWELRYDGTDGIIHWDIQRTDTNDVIVTSKSSWTAGQWFHVVHVWNNESNIWACYVDGSKDNNGSGDLNSGTQYIATLYIADSRNLGQYFDGGFDDIRISNTTRSENWINQSYFIINNQSDFVKFGSEEQKPVLWCTFIQNTTCPLGTARLIGAENDTEGYNNAHAQNNSFNTYNYSLCCNVTDNSSINITSGCPGNATVLKLFNATNTHVEIGKNSNYSIPVCLSTDWKYITCSFPTGSCPLGETCVLSLAGSENNTNSSNAHIGECSKYNQKICCKLENHAPTQPTLYYPANGNTSVFERKPNFNWSQSTDPDGDNVDYTLNITCGSCSASCAEPNVDSISTTNYTITSALCVDTVYNWTVSACDIYDACNTSVIFNFTIASQANLELIINETGFGEMTNDENNDTTDDSPTPLVARNIGNVLLNVTINATALFDSVAMNTQYYQFKADENESGSYDGDCSQNASFANMNTSSKNIFCNLSYEDASDEGEIELNITVPHNEGAGAKSSTMEVGYSLTE